MSIAVYVPRDSAALAAGADRVARRIAAEAAARGADIHLVRNGSRGMFWLEPLVEVATPAGRIACGPVAPEDVAGLFDAGFIAVTSRASFVMVQKTAMAGVPLLAAASAPTSFAVETAQRAGLTLVGFARKNDLVVYCQPQRVLTHPASGAGRAH